MVISSLSNVYNWWLSLNQWPNEEEWLQMTAASSWHWLWFHLVDLSEILLMQFWRHWRWLVCSTCTVTLLTCGNRCHCKQLFLSTRAVIDKLILDTGRLQMTPDLYFWPRGKACSLLSFYLLINDSQSGHNDFFCSSLVVWDARHGLRSGQCTNRCYLKWSWLVSIERNSGLWC